VDTPRAKRQKRPKQIYGDEAFKKEPPFYPACRQLIRTLRAKKESIPFHEPVDTVVVPDYLSIIKTPMDLSTVSEKLKVRAYEVYEDFACDVRLIFRNCVTYNKPDTLYAAYARVLEELFTVEEHKMRARGRLENVVVKPQRNTTPRRRGKPAPEVEDEMMRLKQQLKAIQSQLHGLQGSKAEQALWDVANQGKGKKQRKTPVPKNNTKRKSKSASLPVGLSFGQSDSESDDDEVPMTFEEKCELSENINCLPGHKLGRVVQIIRQYMPELSRGDQDEIEIDIDALDNRTLRHLEGYVNSCLAPTKKQKVKRAAPQAATPKSSAPSPAGVSNSAPSAPVPSEPSAAANAAAGALGGNESSDCSSDSDDDDMMSGVGAHALTLGSDALAMSGGHNGSLY